MGGGCFMLQGFSRKNEKRIDFLKNKEYNAVVRQYK
jgi:hypothetical protein